MSILPFVGRKSELAFVREQMQTVQEGRRRTINLDGEKGIGKTYLLREVRRIYGADARVAVAGHDFDSGYPHPRQVRDAIAQQLDEVVFAAYLETSKEEAELEPRQDKFPARFHAVQEEARQRFEDGYRNLSEQRKVLLTFDTCEAILDTSFVEPFLGWLAKLDNALILLAGYRNAELQDRLIASLGSVTTLTLKALPEEEFKACLESFAVAAEFDDATWEALAFLTGRKPLLLHLAGTWLDRHIALPELVHRPVKELELEAEEARELFEYALVGKIRELASPLDQAVLYMTYLIAPSEPDLWVEMLDIGPQEAEALNGRLRELFFVRADLTLHDAMRELVEKHVWTYVDRDGSQRRALFGRLAAYYRAHAPAEAGWELWVNQTTQLHYRLRTGFDEAFAETMRRFYSEIDRYTMCRELVLIELSRSEWKKCLMPDQEAQLNNKLAYLLVRQGRRDEAKELCQDMLDRQGLEPSFYIEVHSIMGLVVEPERAIGHYQQALEMAEKQGNWQQMVLMMHNLGRAYRKIGRLDEAKHFYEKCIAQSIKHGDLELKASSQNSLAFVYLQKGQLELALNQARLALAARQKAGEDPRPLGYIRQTISAIYQDMFQFETALTNIERAESAFQQAGDERAQAGAWIHKARIYRRLHEPDRVDFFLAQATQVLSLYEAEDDLCAVYNEKACEHRKRGWERYREKEDIEGAIEQFRQSEQDFETSSKYSQQVENWYFLADNLSDLALLYYYWSETVDSEDEKKTLIRKAEDVVQRTIRLSRRYGRYELFESRAIEVRGHIAYSDEAYYKAFTRFYLPACALLSHAFGTSSVRFREVFDRVRSRLLNPEIEDAEIRRISLYMVRRWKEMKLDEVSPNFCETYEAIAADYRPVERGRR